MTHTIRCGKGAFLMLLLLVVVMGPRCTRVGFGVAEQSGAVDAGRDRGQSTDGLPPNEAGLNDGLVPGEWVTIPAGSFTMGSPASEPCREPVGQETEHQVALTHSFEISTTEVTQGQFAGVMGYNPSYFGPNGTGSDCGSTCPVEMVSWYEMAAYCNALSSKKGYARCYQCSGSGASVTCSAAATYSGAAVYDCPGYRLPTEAEWERAYREGTTAAYYNSLENDPEQCTLCSPLDANLDVIGWYCGNSVMPHPVKQKQANAAGLYDMAGNVWEWCHDWWQSDLGSAPVTDPTGATEGSSRVTRGGSWKSVPQHTRAAGRDFNSPAYRSLFVGGRCVKTGPSK